MSKFLIIQTAFIGDVILATPLVEKIHHSFPTATIDFLLRKGNEELFKGHPFLKKVIVFDKKKGRLGELKHIIHEVRNEKYDYVINVQRFLTTGLITTLSGGKCTIGFDKNPLSCFFNIRVKHTIKERLHEIQRNLKLVENITDNLIQQPVLYTTDADNKKVLPYKSKPYVCIAPASVWFTKQYPKEKWVELINALPKQYTIYLIGSKTDFTLAQEIIDCAHSDIKPINLCGIFNLLESAALIKDAAMNYVNDSAPMHLASAVDAKTTAIYCSTISEFGFGPLAKHSKIVEIQNNLICRPCGLHGKKSCPKHHFKCAYDINLEQLLF
jgi:heptosyltransferase-2